VKEDLAKDANGYMYLKVPISKFKKGDPIGGMKDFAHGIATSIPGGGIIFDVALGIMDHFKVGEKLLGGAKAIIKPLKKLTLDQLKMMPVIGPIAGLISAFKKWKTDPKGAIGDALTGMASIIPGGGFVMQGIFSLADHLLGGGGEGGGAGTAPKGEGPPLANKATVNTKTKKPFSFAPKDLLSNAKDLLKNIKGSKIFRASKLAAQAIGRMVGKGIRFFSNNITTEGVQPSVWNNFTGMAQEYKALTGHDIQVNDAWRSKEEQERLHALDPKRAPAFNANNVHYKGVALDVQPSNVDELMATESKKYPGKNLMDAWGFWRPGLNWPFPEAWHIESEATKPYRMSGNKLPVGDTMARGNENRGGGSLFSNVDTNMPQMKIQQKNVSPSGNPKIDLSDTTIALLAKSINESYKSAMPKPSNVTSNIQVNARS
jgi:hypothetical protein